MVDGKKHVKCRFDRCYFQLNAAVDHMLGVCAIEFKYYYSNMLFSIGPSLQGQIFSSR